MEQVKNSARAVKPFAVKGMRITWVVYLSICGRSAIYRKIGFAAISQL